MCLCTQAVHQSALPICKYGTFLQDDPELERLVAHLFKRLKLLFCAVILLHFHFLVPNQNHRWFPFQQSCPCPVHQIAPLFLHLHPSFPEEKINRNVWTFDNHIISITCKWEKIWSNSTYIRVSICNHLIIWAFLLWGFCKEKTIPQSEKQTLKCHCANKAQLHMLLNLQTMLFQFQN